MTFKVTDKLLAAPTLWLTSYSGSGQPVTNPFSYPNRFVGLYKSIDSVYGGAFRPGIFRVNPVTIRSCTGQVTAGGFTCKDKGSPYDYNIVSGALACMWSSSYAAMPNTAWNQNLANQALVKAYNKCQGSSLQGGVILGELMETIHFLKNPLREVLKLLSSPSVKNLSNAWLSYRYGLRPLLKDISDAIALIKKGFRKSQGLLRASGTVKFNDISTSLGSNTMFYGLNARLQTTVVTSISTSCTVYYRVSSSSLSRLEDLGLSPWDIPGIAWELIPLSFVADWFFRVGPWLEAIRPTFSVTYLGNSVSQKSVTKETRELVSVYPLGGYTLSGYSPSHIEKVETKLIRQVNQALPVLPPVNLDYRDFNHVLDSAALLSQRLGNLLSRRR